MGVILDCLGGDWSPVLVGRGLLTWVTVLAYLGCGMLAAAVWRDQEQRVLRRLWGFIALLMLFLAVNKLLDLQTALNQTGRCISMAQGWHKYRRYAQLLFIIMVVAAVIFVFLRGKRMMRGHLRSHWMALTGAALACGFALIRAASLHRVDAIISAKILGLSVNALVEIAALVLIALNAVKLLKPGIQRFIAHQRTLMAERQAAKRLAAQKLAEQKLAEKKLADKGLADRNLAGQNLAGQRVPIPAEDRIAATPADDYRPFRPLKPRGH